MNKSGERAAARGLGEPEVRGGWQVLRRVRQMPLLGDSAAYAGSNLLSRAVPFLLIPVLTRYLTPAEMGVAAMFVLAMNLAGPVVGFSTDAAVARRHVDRNSLDFPNYVANALYVWAATTLLVGVAAILFRSSLSAALAIPRPWLWVAVVAAAARYLVTVRLNIWQMERKPARFAALSFAQTAAALGLAVYLVVRHDWGWEGRVIGEVASLVTFGALALGLLWRGGLIRPGLNRSYLRDSLRYGGGLVPHQYGGLLIGAVDRLFVTNMVGVGETGLYVVGLQVAMVVGAVEQSFNQAWVPWFFGVMARGEAGEIARAERIGRLYQVGLLVFALALAVAAPWLIGILVGVAYAGSVQFVVWLALASAFSGMYKIAASHVYYANRTHWLAAVTLATGIANIALNYVLIKQNGAVGAAQATAAAMLASYLLTAGLAARIRRAVATDPGRESAV